MRWLLPILAGCGGDPEVAETGIVADPVVIPTLSVTSPERGAFTGPQDVSLRGRAAAGTAPLARLLVNGSEATLGADGSFDVALASQPGLNIVGLRVEDDGLERAIDGRAWYAGAVTAPEADVPGAIRLQLGPDLLDDDNPDSDDVASLLELVLADPSFAALVIGARVEAEYFELEPTSMTIGGASVDLTAGEGALSAAIVLSDVDMEFNAYGTGWYDWVSTTGAAHVDSATLTLTVEASASGGVVSVSSSGSSAALQGYAVTVDWFPDSLEDDLADWTQDYLETELAGTAQEMVGTVLGDALSAFAVDMAFGEGLELAMVLSDLESRSTGLQLTMDARVFATRGRTLPSGAGSAQTTGPAPAWPLTTSAPFAAAIDDDFVNQLLFAYWASDALAMSFSGVEIGAMSGAELPAPLGPADTVGIDLDLPAMLSVATQPDMDVDFGMGELLLRFDREDGEVLEFSVNVRTGALVDTTTPGELGFALDDRPSLMTLEIGVIQAPAGLDPGDLAALVRLMVPPLLGNASAFLPAFPTPELPVGDLLGVDALSGVAWTLQDPAIAMDSGGWLVLTGTMGE